MDNVPDALVVGDGGQRLGQCLVIFAHVIVRTRPATADPSPQSVHTQVSVTAVLVRSLGTAGCVSNARLIGKI